MGLARDLEAALDLVTESEKVTIVSHIDADGISSASILERALMRERIDAGCLFVRQLEPFSIRQIPRDGSMCVFLDLGSGQQNLLEAHGFSRDRVFIIDHHVSQPCRDPYREVNALAYGYRKFSAAGMTYLLAKEMDPDNVEFAKLAVVGNVGDMMAREDLGLTGPAREIVKDGVAHGSIRVMERDLNCYGISTRPLHIALSYMDDPFVPGISNNSGGVLRLLQRLGVPLRNQQGDWSVWEDLSDEHRRLITSAIAQQLLANGKTHERLLTENYIFLDEARRTPLRNAGEFATLLNACGRWAKPLIGRAVCTGDRGGAYREAEHMLKHHRTVIRELMEYILDTGAIELSHLQYLHVGGRFPDTIVGIGAGLALSRLKREKPFLVMCRLPEDTNVTKVSMRTVEDVVRRGADLQAALVEAVAGCGGEAGGHRIAAGAYIPAEVEEVFVHQVNGILAGQLDKTGACHR
ncbi:MAG: DHH family phosphoesterase [Methanomicrobiales archaeon]|nr:DHH family phosphoesterase [Methanomicrobiales archaeon]